MAFNEAAHLVLTDVRSKSTKRRALVAILLILAALPLAGALYQALSVRSEARRFPAPGRLIHVAGAGERAQRRLHLICLGQGQPTVIFESSGFGDALSSRLAREEVSAYTRVCSYDRMGMGWSDPGPDVVSAGMLAEDLERLTQQSELRPPFILVPASLGGLTAELFARRHPEQVAGLIFVDAGNSAIIERFAALPTRMQVFSACLVKTAARFGILRLIDPFNLRKQPSDTAAQTIARLYRAEPMATLCAVVRGAPTTMQELTATPPLAPDVPLVVLVHERPDGLFPPGFSDETQMVEKEWLGLQQHFAQSSRRGTWRVVPGSDHLIGNSQPHAVAGAILEMLAQVRRVP
jgi:pimeloyl-ACP methyl ester carboxylesterase